MTLALFLVLVSAKLAAMGGHGTPLTAWGVVAFVWQDALLALAVAVIGRLVHDRAGGRALRTGLYCAFVVYAVINIPIGRALATPLTWPMLRATRGALADSLLLHVTWTNAALIAIVATVASLLPRALSRLPDSLNRAAVVCAIVLVGLGPQASANADMHGRDRNVIVALMQSTFPQVHAAGRMAEWRSSPFDDGASDDLSRFRGTARGRNVVVISLESTAAQYLPIYGGKTAVMPWLSAMAEHSLVFERAYAAYPESIKGLYSVICSTFPAFDVDPDILSRVPCRALPALLRNAGYATALFHSGRFDYLGMKTVIHGRGFDTLEDAGHIGGHHESSFGVDEPSTVSRILEWIDALPGDRPFFVTYLPIAGHHPYETPSAGPFPDDQDFGRYQNALRYGDTSLRALADGLRLRGLDHNTIWVIYGDHGEAFGQHEGNYGHTFLLFDENVRVPFVVVAPTLISGQHRVRRPVSLVDLAPTILDLTGLSVPETYQGSSALGGTSKMALFFTDYSVPLAGLVDGRWKAVHDLRSGRTRLFDLQNDPGETREATLPRRAAWYEQRLKAWSAAQKAYVTTAALNAPDSGP